MYDTNERVGALRIGSLSKQAGCSVPTIRYYEEIGLIPVTARSTSGHRVYGAATLAQLRFIRRCREFGFDLGRIRQLLSLRDSADKDCAEVRGIAQARLVDVRAKLLDLMSLEQALARYVDTCSTTCAGSPAPRCTLFRDLGANDAPSGCCP